MASSTTEETEAILAFENSEYATSEDSEQQDEEETIQKLYEENEELRITINRLNETLEKANSTKSRMDGYYFDGPLKLALTRLPALFLTLFLELIGGVIIDSLSDVIKKYTLLVSFMPVISALSGKLYFSQ